MNRLLNLSLPRQVGCFVVLALLLTLVGNAVHPSGLQYGRDYFPASSGEVTEEGQLPEHPFVAIDGEELADVVEFATGDLPDIILLDARTKGNYEVGHIPGAWRIDPYGDDPTSIVADQLARDNFAYVVVYCRGGDCEDSLQLAHELVYRKGVNMDLVRVYEGGLLDWTARGGALAGGPDREGPEVAPEFWEDPEAAGETAAASREPLMMAIPLAILLGLLAVPSLRPRVRPLLPWAGGLTLAFYAYAKLALPSEFLKAVHGYGVLPTDPPWMLNLSAAGIPWMETAAAICLLVGPLRRGASLVLSVFLLVFTAAIVIRAGAEAGGGLLSYAFDCGCGTGMVIVWQKLLANLTLLGVLGGVVCRRTQP